MHIGAADAGHLSADERRARLEFRALKVLEEQGRFELIQDSGSRHGDSVPTIPLISSAGVFRLARA
jgi:hypothetical protein